MSGKAAVHAILLSAAVMGGIYAWRWLTSRGSLPATAELSAAKLIGYGPQVSPEGFLVAWGVVYGGLSILAMLAPGMAGSLALLILLTGAIANFGSASQTALGLVKVKTGTEPSGPESEGTEAVEGGNVPTGALSALSGFTGGFTPIPKKGEHAPTHPPPAPTKIKLPKMTARQKRESDAFWQAVHNHK
jgi:hypothetical protein